MAKNDALGITLLVNSAESEKEIRKRLGEIIESINKNPNENHEIILKVNSSKTQDNISQAIEQAIKNIGGSKSSTQTSSLNLPVDKNTITNNIVESTNKAIQELQSKPPVINIDTKLSEKSQQEITNIKNSTAKTTNNKTSSNNATNHLLSSQIANLTNITNNSKQNKNVIDTIDVADIEKGNAAISILISKIKKAGFETSSLMEDAKAWQDALNSVNTKTDFKEWISELGVLRKQFKAMKENPDLIQKDQIDKTVSSIDSLINKIANTEAKTDNLRQEFISITSQLETLKSKAENLNAGSNISELKQVELEYKNISNIVSDLQSKNRISPADVNSLIADIKSQQKELLKPNIFQSSNLVGNEMQELDLLIEKLNSVEGIDSFNKIKSEFDNISSVIKKAKSEIGVLIEPDKVIPQVGELQNKVEKVKQIFARLGDGGGNTTLQQAIANISTQVSDLEPKMTKLNGLIKDFKPETATEEKLREITSLYNELFLVAKNTHTAVNNALNIKSSIDAIKKDEAELSNLMNNIKKYGTNNNRLYSSSYLTGQYNDLLLAVENAQKSIVNGNTNAGVSVKQLKRDFESLKANVMSVGKTGKTFGTKLAEQFSKLGVYLSAATVFMRIRTEIRKMYDNVVEVDSAMTELKKVTEETDSTYTKFLNNAISRSKKLGATLSDTISASADMARLGYNLDEASTLADNALIYKQVGDDIEDISEASKSLISTMKAFGVNAEDSIGIVDKFNEVSNKFSISSGGIGDALQNSASSLSAANNTLSESIGLIVAGNDVIQNPEEVGTAIKTLSMRLRSSKVDMESLGEDTDGMADSVSDLRQKILALSKVDIMKNSDEFKSTYQILKELSQVWGSLSDANQATITELVAGKLLPEITVMWLKNHFNCR